MWIAICFGEHKERYLRMSEELTANRKRIKLFELPLSNGSHQLEQKIDQWLELNEDIELISTDLTVSEDRYLCAVIYQRVSESSNELEVKSSPSAPQLKAAQSTSELTPRKSPLKAAGGAPLQRAATSQKQRDDEGTRELRIDKSELRRESLTSNVLFNEE